MIKYIVHYQKRLQIQELLNNNMVIASTFLRFLSVCNHTPDCYVYLKADFIESVDATKVVQFESNQYRRARSFQKVNTSNTYRFGSKFSTPRSSSQRNI